MNNDHYPGIRLKELLGEAGLLTQFDEAIRAKNYATMKEIIGRVATSQDEAQHFGGVVFANPEHYDTVISDLHYNGKTVNERLAFEGLLDQFTAAVQAKDDSKMVELMEQTAITTKWATRISKMILEGPPQATIHLNLTDPRNAGLLHARSDLKFPPCIRPVECPRDPYMYLGSHPDAVERVWDQLGSILPQDCRCIVFGTPGLIAPRSGIVLAKAFGTAYILRIPRDAVEEAIQAGAETKMTWTTKNVTNLTEEYGDDWIFGKYLKQEPGWLLAGYKSVDG
jgi:hypothetical protein